MVFYAEFGGHYLGGHAVVTAKAEDVAYQLVIEEGERRGLNLKKKDINLTQINARKNYVHAFDNGDY